MPSRRQFLQASLATAFAPGEGLSAQVEFIPVRAIPRGPQFHGFAYCDKLQFYPRNRLVFGHRIDFQHRSPRQGGRQMYLIDVRGIVA